MVEFSAQCYVPAWMGERLGGEWVQVYEWLKSPFTLYLRVSQHYTSVYKIKSSKKKFGRIFLWNSLELALFGCLAPLMLFSISSMEMDLLDLFVCLFHFGSTLLNYILLEYYFFQVLKKNVIWRWKIMLIIENLMII